MENEDSKTKKSTNENMEKWEIWEWKSLLSCTTKTLLPTNRKSTLARTNTARECSSWWSNLEVVSLLARRRESLFIFLRTFSNSLGLAPRATPWAQMTSVFYTPARRRCRCEVLVRWCWWWWRQRHRGKVWELRRDCCSRGLQICAISITLSLSLSMSLSLSTGAKTFDTNQQKWARELRHSMESASASEMSKVAETFDDFWTKALQNLSFRGVWVSDMSLLASCWQIPANSTGAVPICGPLCVDSFDLMKTPKRNATKELLVLSMVLQIVFHTEFSHQPGGLSVATYTLFFRLVILTHWKMPKFTWRVFSYNFWIGIESDFSCQNFHLCCLLDRQPLPSVGEDDRPFRIWHLPRLPEAIVSWLKLHESPLEHCPCAFHWKHSPTFLST